MANTLRDTFSDIADAIRAKGVTGTMTPLEMPTKIGSISGGGTKYGLTMDNILGDVNGSGALQPPTSGAFSSNDIVSIPQNGLKYKFYNSGAITSVILPNLTTVGDNGLQNAFQYCTGLTSVDLSSLTSAENFGLQNAFYGCTSLASVDLSSLTTVGDYGLNSAFRGCTGLTSVDLSSLASAGNYGLQNAFSGCTGLTSVDLSSLASAGNYGLSYAFSGCTGLTSVNLSSLASAGNNGLSFAFSGCTSLKDVYLSKLSSVGLSGMLQAFYNCPALELVDFSQATAVPELSSTSAFGGTTQGANFKIRVPNALYDQWIAATNWSNPTIKPHIEKAVKGIQFNATTAGSTIKLMAVGSPSPVSLKYSVNLGTFSTYTIGDTITLTNIGDNVLFVADTNGNVTFSDDSSNYYKFVITGSMSVEETPEYLLDESGELNTIPDYAFYGLFEDCTALDNAPALQNTSLGEYCYASMFKGCTGLTTAPELPATTLDVGCYENMFNGCTGIEVAPTLPATTLATGCYNGMFYGCSSLNEISLDYTGNFSTTYFDNWVYGVAASGTFHYNGNDTSNFGVSAIPTGWTVAIDYTTIPLTFTAREANSTISMAKSGSAPTVSLQYSTDDGATWNTFTVGTTTVTLANVGDKVLFRGTNSTMASSYNSNYNYFVMTGKVDASGNINSILSSNDFDNLTTCPQCAYPRLFNNCTALVDASKLILASTTASQNSYGHGMFAGCSNLVDGPEIRATNFTSLNYTGEYMFQNCSSLQSVKIYATGSSWTSSATVSWMSGVSSTGTFYYNGTYTGRGASYIPSGWTITPFIPDDQKDRSCIRCFKADMNTGVIPTTTTKVVATLRGTAYGNWFIGNSGQKYRFFDSATTTYLDVNGMGNRISTANSWDTTKWYDVEFGNFYFKTTDPDGVVVTNTSTARTFTQTDPLYLNSYSYSYSGNYSLFDCAGFKIYDGNTLLKEYEPAVDGNGVYCFLEKVSNTYAYPTNGVFGGYIQPTT